MMAVHPFIHQFLPFYPYRGRRGAAEFPSYFEREVGHTLYRSFMVMVHEENALLGCMGILNYNMNCGHLEARMSALIVPSFNDTFMPFPQQPF